MVFRVTKLLNSLVLISGLILCWGFSGVLHAQDDSFSDNDCVSKLRNAERDYEEGFLLEVLDPEGVTKCIPRLDRKEKIEAYQLLTEANLFENRFDDADANFQNLLIQNPLFYVDSSMQNASYELIRLSETYRRKPLAVVYGGVGMNYSRLEILQYYGTDNTSYLSGSSDYHKRVVVGLNGSVGVEIPVFFRFDIVLEASLSSRSYYYQDSVIISNGYVNDPRNQDTETTSAFSGTNNPFNTAIDQDLVYAKMQFRENQFWVDVPLLVRYNWEDKRFWGPINSFSKPKKVIPYVYAGVSANFLVAAYMRNPSYTTTLEGTGIGNDINNLNLNNNRVKLLRDSLTSGNISLVEPSIRSTFNVAVIGGLGCKIRLERNFLFFDLRYNRFLFNGVKKDTRYGKSLLVHSFGYVDNDYRMDNFMFTVGFAKAFYKPKKRRKFDPARIELKFNLRLKKANKDLENAVRKGEDETINALKAHIASLERSKSSLISDVQRGKNTVGETLDKATDLKKGVGSGLNKKGF